MMRTCPVCKRTYKRKKCEYCRREELWNDKKILSIFSPRIQKDLKTLKTIEKKDPAIIETGLYIYGPVGSGKSIFAANLTVLAAKKYFIERSGAKTFEFITVPNLLQEIKSTFSNASEEESKILTRLCAVDWLVLDDIGVGKHTEWTSNILYLIINHRYEHLKITIFTSNVDPDDLERKFDDARIPSRIIGMCQTKTMLNKDYRNQ